MSFLTRKQVGIIVATIVLTAVTGGMNAAHFSPVVTFIVAAIALALLANLIGEATEQLGVRLGPGATGVLQSALGNLPELFLSIFALRAGLTTVVQAALIGSILGNSLLVLGLAFLVGGLKHGTLKFNQSPARMITVLTLLSVAALAMPTLTSALHTPANSHENELSAGVAVTLLIVFLASIPFSLQGNAPPPAPHGEANEPMWPLWATLIILAVSGGAAALTSDWFVEALQPTMKTLHISDAFAGLVIVAIAGNAVENFVGVQLAYDNKPDYAISIILNSSLQVALALTPILVLLSFFVSPTPMTLVFSPLLIAILFFTTLINALIVTDGEANWLEGVILIGLYGIIAASFWWG